MSPASPVTTATRHHLTHIARGGLGGLAGAVVAGAAGFILVVIVARGLDATQAGVFFTLTAVFLIIEGLAVLGTDTGLARFLLRLEAEGRSGCVSGLVRAAIGTSTAAAVVLGLVLALVADPVHQALGWSSESTRALQVLALTLPCAVLCDVALAVTRALGVIRTTVLVDRMARAVSQPVLVGVALWSGTGLTGAVTAWAATHLLGAVAALVLMGRCLAQRGHRSPWRRESTTTAGLLGTFWSYTWLRGLARVAQLSMQKLDIVLVAVLVSPSAGAAYTVATRFVPLGQMATQSIQQVLQPRLTAILVHERDETLAQVHQIATAWSILLAWPLHLGVGALALSYLDLFGARQAEHAPSVVVVMALTMMVAVAAGPVDTLLLMAGRSGLSAANTVVALAIDVAGCLLLLPSLGILGAALAWSAAVVTRCVLAAWQVRHDLQVRAWSPVVLRACLLAVGCVGVPAWLFSLVDPAPMLLAVGVLLIGAGYLGVVWRLRASLGLSHLLVPGRPGAVGVAR